MTAPTPGMDAAVRRPKPDLSMDASHEAVAAAMVLCQDGSASCFQSGVCAYEGDCFRSDKRARSDAARAILKASESQSPLVREIMVWAAQMVRNREATP